MGSKFREHSRTRDEGYSPAQTTKTLSNDTQKTNQVMIRIPIPLITRLLAVTSFTVATVSAAPKAAPETPLTDAGNKLLPKYADQLGTLQTEIAKVLPKIDGQSMSALQKAGEALKTAEAEAKAAQLAMGKIEGAKGLVAHAKGKWIGGAEKGIAQAEAALKKEIGRAHV